jgi:hypothetical protein
MTPVKLGGTELPGWQTFNLPLDDKDAWWT